MVFWVMTARQQSCLYRNLPFSSRDPKTYRLKVGRPGSGELEPRKLQFLALVSKFNFTVSDLTTLGCIKVVGLNSPRAAGKIISLLCQCGDASVATF